VDPRHRPDPPALSESGVLIVGGTSGMGLAAARAFVGAGAARLALVGRNLDRGKAIRDQLSENSSTDIEFVAADVSTPEGAQHAVEQALSHLRRVDVLINAAAAPHLPGLFHLSDLDAIPTILHDLVLPALLMSRAVLPRMRAQSAGCIINIASDAAKVTTPGEALIGAAMSAIVTFSRTLAMEAKRDGIRINVLTPSLVEDTGTAVRLFDDDFSSRLFTKARERAHLGVSTADDQAALMLYLAGPHGRRVTGQAISINGGISAA
jgi:2-hydroxycyclohexanecarboxyl-CoA dehydrogenase